MDILLKTIELGSIYGIMVLGVYITYRILDFPDLTVDGSFPLGAAIVGALLTKGVSPILAVCIAALGGLGAGYITGFLHVKLKITNLLSGILSMIALYSINLRIMGKPNIPLFNEESVFLKSIPIIIQIILIVLLIKLFIDLFLKTKFGFVLRATGDNPQMVTSLGIDIGKMKIIGIMISNMLVAISGALIAQYQGVSDSTMGTGIVVMGLASIIIGEAIFKKASWVKATSCALVGSIFYRLSIAMALKWGMEPSDLKLITAIIVVVALGLTNGQISLKWIRSLKRGKFNASA